MITTLYIVWENQSTPFSDSLLVLFDKQRSIELIPALYQKVLPEHGGSSSIISSSTPAFETL